MLNFVSLVLFSSSWGERLLTLAQSVAIVFLILHYRGKTMKGIWMWRELAYFDCSFPTRRFSWYRFAALLQRHPVAIIRNWGSLRKEPAEGPWGVMFQRASFFSGFSFAGLWLLSAYSAAMFLLGSYAAAAVVSLLHESRLAASIASKVIT